MFLFAQGCKGFITVISWYNLGPSDNAAMKIMGGFRSSCVLFKQTARKWEEKNLRINKENRNPTVNLGSCAEVGQG